MAIVTPEQKFRELVASSKDAIEDFNNFLEDKAIVWAASRIKTLEDEISRHKQIMHDLHALHCEPDNCVLNGEDCVYDSYRTELK